MRNRTLTCFGLLGLGLLAGGAAPAREPVGTAFSYQGWLTEGGAPATGAYDFQFDLYDAAAGGSLVAGPVTCDDQPVVAGLFAVALDFGVAAFDGQARWLEVAVRAGASGGLYTPLSPRQPLMATPYASQTRGLFVDDQLRVGIGTTAPECSLQLVGDLRATSRAALGNRGGFGPGVTSNWVFDLSHELTDFSSAELWFPLRADIYVDPDTDLTGANARYIYSHDLVVTIDAGNDKDLEYVQGPYALAMHRGSGDINILAGAFLGAQNHGSGHVTYQLGADCFSVVTGPASTENNYGCEIRTGCAWASTGTIENDFGLYVCTPATDGTVNHHYGIYLEDQAGGVSSSYAIYAAGGDSYLGGDLEVAGTLSKGAGAFKIDHPLDPANQYLYHSFVESPDMLNIYNGLARTDGRGYATVPLPPWFEALNRDFRYQLTVLDEADTDEFVQVKVVRKIAHNAFVIRTSAPNVEVSWQVTGIRQDPFANANRIPVEVDKSPEERGLYLHPAAAGRPAGMGIARQRQHAAPPWTPARREGR